jgi:hypothetical protein
MEHGMQASNDARVINKAQKRKRVMAIIARTNALHAIHEVEVTTCDESVAQESPGAGRCEIEIALALLSRAADACHGPPLRPPRSRRERRCRKESGFRTTAEQQGVDRGVRGR